MNDFSIQEIHLDVAPAPASLPFEDYLDYFNAQLLLINHIDTSTHALEEILISDDPQTSAILKGAAAHYLGTLADTNALATLQKSAANPNEMVALESQYACFRLSPEVFQLDTIKYHLLYDTEAYYSPGPAAGYLAKHGKTDGYFVIQRLLASKSRISRMSAAKQLYFFYALDQQPTPQGDRVDAIGLLRIGLHDKEPSIREQTLQAIDYLNLKDDRVNSLVEGLLPSETDPQNRRLAEKILADFRLEKR